MSDTDQLWDGLKDLADELHGLDEKLQREIKECQALILSLQDAVLQLQTIKRDELAAAVPVPQSLRA